MGPDDLNILLFKVFAIPLTLIYQESERPGEIPAMWKDACVTPLFKERSEIQRRELLSHQFDTNYM